MTWTINITLWAESDHWADHVYIYVKDGQKIIQRSFTENNCIWLFLKTYPKSVSKFRHGVCVCVYCTFFAPACGLPLTSDFFFQWWKRHPIRIKSAGRALQFCLVPICLSGSQSAIKSLQRCRVASPDIWLRTSCVISGSHPPHYALATFALKKKKNSVTKSESDRKTRTEKKICYASLRSDHNGKVVSLDCGQSNVLINTYISLRYDTIALISWKTITGS